MNINTSIKLTRRLQIQKIPLQVYLQDYHNCNIQQCLSCQNTDFNGFNIKEDNTILLIDKDILYSQLDIIEQCAKFRNLIILNSFVKEAKMKSQTYQIQLQNLMTCNYSKICYEYPDKFSIYTQGQQGQPAIIKFAEFYKKHINENLSDAVKFVLLTDSYQNFTAAKSLNIEVYTLNDYLRAYCPENLELLDYLGFSEMQEQDQMGDKLFAPHLNLQESVDKIKQGLLFEGKLYVDRNDLQLCKIYVRKMNLEIRIIDQNRSLFQDRVAVQILPQKDWIKKQQERIMIEDETEDIPTTEPTEELNQMDSLHYLARNIQDSNLIPTGRVVSVLQRNEKRHCGHVEEVRENEYYFYPADGRYPRFLLRSSKNLNNKKIVVQFIDWPEWSEYPQARLLQVLGNQGDMYVEGNVILLEHQVEIREFSRDVLKCLPNSGEKWEIPNEEVQRRMDLRSIPVVSIDPIGCKDIDDALHCQVLPNGNYQVGVHIADVSYFVRPDTPIDKEAAHRCTTVYLVDRRTDMLPKLLTENLCSLTSNADHLTFSVLWELDQNANVIITNSHIPIPPQIVNSTFAKSIIRSRAALNYGQAQEMIDNKQDNSEITQSIRNLNHLAKVLKQQRIEAGALSLASNQVKFSFDEETHNPNDVRMYSFYETNSLVEEFMLLANVSVAEKVLSRFPAISVLRRHSEPKPKQISELQALMKEIGYEFEYGSSRELQNSLDQIKRNNDTFFNKLIRIMTTRCMNEALYICTSDVDYPELYHYGLAAQLYTHFTSPIRRYADVLVHRLLAAAIDLESLPPTMSNKIRMSRICDKMNMRHRNARMASRASSDYHTYLFFKNRALQGQNEEEGIVTGILGKGFSVILPKYGLEGFIEFSPEDVKINKQLLREDKLNINVQVNGNKHSIFDHIRVKIEVQLKSFHKQVILCYLGPQ